MKKVTYLGKQYEVPDNMLYLAADTDGELYAYSHKPIWKNTLECGMQILAVPIIWV